MQNKKNSDEKPQKKRRKTILGAFFTREEPDKEYLPELKDQWASMEKGERVKFIIGASVGLVVFIAALVLAYMVISGIIS
jgi:hypothetical protein